MWWYAGWCHVIRLPVTKCYLATVSWLLAYRNCMWFLHTSCQKKPFSSLGSGLLCHTKSTHSEPTRLHSDVKLEKGSSGWFYFTSRPIVFCLANTKSTWNPLASSVRLWRTPCSSGSSSFYIFKFLSLSGKVSFMLFELDWETAKIKMSSHSHSYKLHVQRP